MLRISTRVVQGLLETLPKTRCMQRPASSGRIILSSHRRPTLPSATLISRYNSTNKDLSDLEKKEKHQQALDANFSEDPEKASGKTVVNILNHEAEEGLFFTSYSCLGFRLSNDMRVMGPCAVFPRSILHWNIAGAQAITEASLSLFTLLEPKLDILIIGVGERENVGAVNPEIIKYLRIHKINMEILPTAQALATFNFLNSEKRYVAGAMIPPSYVEEDRFDEGNSRFTSLADKDEDALFRMKTDYDYIPNEGETIIGDWEKREEQIKETIYKRSMREKDKLENPQKYLD